MGWRVGYKVALGVSAVGLLMLVWSPLIGGPVYDRTVTPLLDLLGAPEDREFLPAEGLATGAEVMALLGVCNVAAGVCMFCALLVLELLGFGGAPVLTRRMRPRGKLALGMVAAGLALLVASHIPRFMLSSLFLDHEQAVAWLLGALGGGVQVGSLLMVCAAVTRFLDGDHAHGPLLRWTEVAGWGKAHLGWINKLALALVAGGLVGTILWFLPFGEVAGAFVTVGLTVLVLGIIPQLLAIGRP